jgi:mannosyltransferase OCH1-like enzyme
LLSHTDFDILYIMKNFTKIIWQTHKWDYENLPEIYKKTSKTWQIMNPDWEYKYISNSKIRDELEKLNNKNLLIRFDLTEGYMGKADIYREAMVYEYGGLWADMDSVCLFPIDKIIKHNQDKEMICISPITKFGMDPNKNYDQEDINESINKLLLGIESGYWISNAVFLGKKHNKISEKIFESITGSWKFKESSYMGMRSELYEKYHDLMSLDLLCGFHDGRFNLRNY